MKRPPSSSVRPIVGVGTIVVIGKTKSFRTPVQTPSVQELDQRSSWATLPFARYLRPFALQTAVHACVAFDLLVAACYTSQSDSLSWLVSFGQPPSWVDPLAVDFSRNTVPVIIYVKAPLPRNLFGPYVTTQLWRWCPLTRVGRADRGGNGERVRRGSSYHWQVAVTLMGIRQSHKFVPLVSRCALDTVMVRGTHISEVRRRKTGV